MALRNQQLLQALMARHGTAAAVPASTMRAPTVRTMGLLEQMQQQYPYQAGRPEMGFDPQAAQSNILPGLIERGMDVKTMIEEPVETGIGLAELGKGALQIAGAAPTLAMGSERAQQAARRRLEGNPVAMMLKGGVRELRDLVGEKGIMGAMGSMANRPVDVAEMMLGVVPGGAVPKAAKAAKAARAAKKPSIEIGATDVHDQVGGESFASKILSVDGVPKAGADLSIYGDKVYIQHVQTLPDAQRQGYAKQLIDNLIEEHPDKKIALTLMTGEGEKFFSNTYDIADDMTIAPKSAAKAVPEPPQRSLLERLAKGVEDPGALEKARLGGGGKVLRPDYDEDYHDKLLRQLNEASANNDTEAIKKIDAELSAIVEPVTPEIESQRISQLAALDALEPVEKARLDRAVEQGFDLDAFHGTKGDIEAFDPGLLGETTNAPSARLGFFFSADAKTAETYSWMADLREINPGKQNVKNELAALDINDPNYDQKRAELKKLQKGDRLSEIESALQKEKLALEKEIPSATKMVELQARIKSLEKRGESSVKLKKELKDLEELRRVAGNKARTTMLKLDRMGANIMPVKLRLQNPLEYDFEGNGYRDTSYRALLENAKNRGHDGAIFRNTTDGSGVTDIYVVFEPAQIRSRFAAFDPKDTPKAGLGQNAKLANEALKINREQLADLVRRKKELSREWNDLFALPDPRNNPENMKIIEQRAPKLRQNISELDNKIKALQDGMDRLLQESKIATIGTGDITASFAPVVLPLGAGTAAAAYLANQEQE